MLYDVVFTPKSGWGLLGRIYVGRYLTQEAAKDLYETTRKAYNLLPVEYEIYGKRGKTASNTEANGDAGYLVIDSMQFSEFTPEHMKSARVYLAQPYDYHYPTRMTDPACAAFFSGTALTWAKVTCKQVKLVVKTIPVDNSLRGRLVFSDNSMRFESYYIDYVTKTSRFVSDALPIAYWHTIPDVEITSLNTLKLWLATFGKSDRIEVSADGRFWYWQNNARRPSSTSFSPRIELKR